MFKRSEREQSHIYLSDLSRFEVRDLSAVCSEYFQWIHRHVRIRARCSPLTEERIR